MQNTWTHPQSADRWLLIQTIFTCLGNALAWQHAPSLSPVSVSWPISFAYSLLEGALATDLPPAHVFLQFLGMAPVVL